MSAPGDENKTSTEKPATEPQKADPYSQEEADDDAARNAKKVTATKDVLQAGGDVKHVQVGDDTDPGNRGISASFKSFFSTTKQKLAKGAHFVKDKSVAVGSVVGTHLQKGYNFTADKASKASTAIITKISGPEPLPEDERFVGLLDQLSRTEGQILLLIEQTSNLIKSQHEYLQFEQTWATNVGKSVSGDTTTALYDQKCTEVGGKLLAVSQKRQQTFKSLQRLFVGPLNTFRENEITHAKKLRQEYHESKRKYDLQTFNTQKVREQAPSEAQRARLAQAEQILNTKREFYNKIKAQFTDIMSVIAHKKNSEVKQHIEQLAISFTNMHRDSLKILIESPVDRAPDVL